MGNARKDASTWAAAAAAAAAALRVQIGPGLIVCVVVAFGLLPVWWPALHRYRFARPIVVLGLAALANGVVLTWWDNARVVKPELLRYESFTLAAMVGAIGLLLWARTHIGGPNTAIAYGVGAIANLTVTGVHPDNPWKYSLAVPAAIILLGITARSPRRVWDVAMLLGLAVVSLLSDSRSMTAFLLLAAVVVGWEAASSTDARRSRPWVALLTLGGIGLAAFNVFQALILDGALGEAARQRTQVQLQSGSLLTGGRPEMGAAVELLRARPWGYGSGLEPLSRDVWTAKSGMSELNYDPNNGYVMRYMFGGRFEVHSVLGDGWIRFGVPGAIFFVALLALAVYAAARAISTRNASGLVVFLMLLGAWDTFFSPLLTSYRNLALLFALAAITRTAAVSPDRKRPGETAAPITTRGQAIMGANAQ